MHYNKLGIYLTRHKQESLLRGDTSNAAVHSMFVYQACSYGMFFSKNFAQVPSALDFQAKYVQLAWQGIVEIRKGNDDYLKAQAMLSVSSCSIVFRWIEFARQYIQKACHVVNTASLQFIPTYGQPPEYSEQVRERSTVLSQVIYFENYLFLAYGGQKPELTAGIEKEFRHEFQVGNQDTSEFISTTHRFYLANVSDAVHDLSVNHEDAGHFVSEGCHPSSQCLPRRW